MNTCAERILLDCERDGGGAHSKHYTPTALVVRELVMATVPVLGQTRLAFSVMDPLLLLV